MKKMKMSGIIFGMFFLFCILGAQPVGAMHIMEGFLPLGWAIFWWILAIPFIGIGLYRVGKIFKDHPEKKVLLAISAAFTFALSAFKLPSVTGSSSHMTGIGLGAIILGPFAMVVVGTMALLFQALLLAHGGLTTLGANVFSMAVVGSFIGYGVFRGLGKLKCPKALTIFLAAFLADLLTYVTTSIQLALAFPDSVGGVLTALSKFLGIFAVTQIPLGIIEGILTVLVVNTLVKYNEKGGLKDETITRF
ncbi:MAG: energy-coupling factor ABC transporter permease [Eubacteriaceae bacterium]